MHTIKSATIYYSCFLLIMNIVILKTTKIAPWTGERLCNIPNNDNRSTSSNAFDWVKHLMFHLVYLNVNCFKYNNSPCRGLRCLCKLHPVRI